MRRRAEVSGISAKPALGLWQAVRSARQSPLPRRAEAAEATVRTMYGELLDAWNRHSADDFARRFADDALLVTVDGDRVPGASLPQYFRLVFVDHPEAHCVGHVLGIRPVGSNAVMLHAIAGIVPAGNTRINPAVNTVHTLLAEKRSGAWQIVLFQNTPADYHGRPELADQLTTQLQQIIDANHRDPGDSSTQPI